MRATNRVRVRPARRSDIPALLALDTAISTTEAMLTDLVAATYVIPPMYVFSVAIRARAPVGFVVYDAYPRTQAVDEPPICRVWRLAVAPSARRAGIGRMLLDHAQEQRPDAALTALVSEYEVEAQLFLRACGFHVPMIQRNIAVAARGSDPADAYMFVRDPA